MNYLPSSWHELELNDVVNFFPSEMQGVETRTTGGKLVAVKIRHVLANRRSDAAMMQ